MPTLFFANRSEILTEARANNTALRNGTICHHVWSTVVIFLTREAGLLMGDLTTEQRKRSAEQASYTRDDVLSWARTNNSEYRHGRITRAEWQSRRDVLMNLADMLIPE